MVSIRFLAGWVGVRKHMSLCLHRGYIVLSLLRSFLLYLNIDTKPQKLERYVHRRFY